MAGGLQADIVVIGGGPAAAAAIRALGRSPLSLAWITGVDRTVDDAAAMPVETLDAGAMRLIETQFGVAPDAVRALPYPRSPATAGRRGFHIHRPILDRLLRDAVRARASVEAIDGRARAARCGVDRRLTIEMDDGRCVTGRFVIDAAGRRHFLARQLGSAIRRVTRPLLLARSVGSAVTGDAPEFSGRPCGWLWRANEAADRSTWNVLVAARHPVRRAALREAMAGESAGPVEYIDATWRIVHPAAAETYALAGEAAMVLDPAAGDGIEAALRLGDAAARLAVTCLLHAEAAPFAAARYDDTVRRAFGLRAGELRRRYAAMGIDLPLAPMEPASDGEEAASGLLSG